MDSNGFYEQGWRDALQEAMKRLHQKMASVSVGNRPYEGLLEAGQIVECLRMTGPDSLPGDLGRRAGTEVSGDSGQLNCSETPNS